MFSPGEERKEIKERPRAQVKKKSVVRVAKRSQRTRRTIFDRSKMMESHSRWLMRKALSTRWQTGSRICLTCVAIVPVALQRIPTTTANHGRISTSESAIREKALKQAKLGSREARPRPSSSPI